MADKEVIGNNTVFGRIAKEGELESFANPNHLDSISKGGQVTSKSVILGLDAGNGSIIGIGALQNINISIQNQVLQISEIGSKKYTLVMGKTQPFSMQLGKAFIHRRNFLSFLNEAGKLAAGTTLNNLAPTSQKEVRALLGVVERELIKPRDYILLISQENLFENETGLDFEKVTKIILKETVIQSYGMNFGQGIVLMENCSLMGAGINDYGGNVIQEYNQK